MSEATCTADAQLARALTTLETFEQENKGLREQVRLFQQQLQETDGRMRDLMKRVTKLESTKEELMHVNSQWDIEYREIEEAFRRYRYDSQQAQTENHAVIAKLKREKDELHEEIKTLKFELDRSGREMESLRVRLETVEQQRAASSSHREGVSQQKVAALEEEITLLRQQLKTYQEDFEAERRDRERMQDEKQSASLRYEAEITSLRLQLDRCRNELTHYTTEATRLGQQLRLKTQYEDDQYKKHLESRGYVPRSPNGTLPPLDPFVEIDQQHYAINPPSKRTGRSTVRSPDTNAYNGETSQYANQSHVRGVADASSQNGEVSQYTNRSHVRGVADTSSQNGEISKYANQSHGRGVTDTSTYNGEVPPSRQRGGGVPMGSSSVAAVQADGVVPGLYRGSDTRVPTHALHRKVSPAGLLHRGLESPPQQTRSEPVITQQRTSYTVAPPLPRRSITPPSYSPALPSSQPHPITNGYHNHVTSPKSVSQSRHESVPINNFHLNASNLLKYTASNPEAARIPPLETKGKYSCPRCARRFADKTEFTDHKIRCIN